MRHDESPIVDSNAAAAATDQQADALLQLFTGLLAEFPDASFSARALIKFAGAIAEHLPAQQRLSIARAMLTEAARLGFLWH